MDHKLQNILFSINDADKEGHGADIRSTVNITFEASQYMIFQDQPKKPESIFSSTVEAILINDLILLDSTPHKNIIDKDILIQFGICYALNKKSAFFLVVNNTTNITHESSLFIADYQLPFEHYLDISEYLRERLSRWVNQKSFVGKTERNKVMVHSFSVFGINKQKQPDLEKVVIDFSDGTDWKPRFYSALGAISTIKELAIDIGIRSFCLFCLDNDDDEKLFISVGIAIGMGIPFLVIHSTQTNLPLSLMGYDGVIKYENYSQLSENLNKYASSFLSENVQNWEGGTYYYLLSQIEKAVGEITSIDLEKVEKVLKSINTALGSMLAKPYSLLGDVYREKNRLNAPEDINLLLQAKEYYQKALEIQQTYKRCEDAIAAIEKHIEIIELVKEHKYQSLPSLIRLIGEDLTSSHYLLVRNYLIDEVRKLINESDYLHALSLLAAIQIHDKSELVQNLIQDILKTTPWNTQIEALQATQEQIIELEKEKTSLINDVFTKSENEKNLLSKLNLANQYIDELKGKLASISKQLTFIQTAKENLEKEKTNLINQVLSKNENEKNLLSKLKVSNQQINELKNKLASIFKQLKFVQTTKDKLEERIVGARHSAGRAIIVNFGIGWAIYKPLSSKPQVLRNDKLIATIDEGFVVVDGDYVQDDSGNGEHYLPKDTQVILPKNN